MMRLVNGAMSALSSLVFPRYCLGCGEESEPGEPMVCQTCLEDLAPYNTPGRIKVQSSLRVAFKYDELMQQLVHLLKFNCRREIGSLLGAESFRVFEMTLREHRPECIIPVPLHAVRIRERGFNQCEVIGEEISRLSEIPLESRILRRIRNTKRQSRLSINERKTNLENAFKADTSNFVHNPEHPVVLLDDVIHTGSTVRECISALNYCGISNILVLAVCG